MRTHGVYRASVKDYKLRSRQKFDEARRAYDGLSDWTTAYAQEVKALMDLHAAVFALWDSAEDDIKPEGVCVCTNCGTKCPVRRLRTSNCSEWTLKETPKQGGGDEA